MALSIIINNDLSASYFTYKDEYWTLFYEKPYARLPCYLVGVVWGCSYFSYKYEDEDEQEEELPSPIAQARIHEEEDPSDGAELEEKTYKK